MYAPRYLFDCRMSTIVCPEMQMPVHSSASNQTTSIVTWYRRSTDISRLKVHQPKLRVAKSSTQPSRASSAYSNGPLGRTRQVLWDFGKRVGSLDGQTLWLDHVCSFIRHCVQTG